MLLGSLELVHIPSHAAAAHFGVCAVFIRVFMHPACVSSLPSPLVSPPTPATLSPSRFSLPPVSKGGGGIATGGGERGGGQGRLRPSKSFCVCIRHGACMRVSPLPQLEAAP
jgi:hypothetical protein